MVETISSVKKTTGPLLKNYIIKIGSCVTKMNLYKKNLGIYDLIIGMDWLESHIALVYFYAKKVLYQNDQGDHVVIEGVKQ